MNHNRKPSGYWHNFANLERELLAFIEECGIPSVMPTHDELKKAGRSELSMAIQRHGGSTAVAKQLRLTYTRKTPAYWDDINNLAWEIAKFNEEHGTPGVMPTQQALKKNGRPDIRHACDKHGGRAAVAKRLKLKLTHTRKPTAYWDDINNLGRELATFNEEHGTPGVMPTQQTLIQARRTDIVNAFRKHGGFAGVAEQLGLLYDKKQYDYWNDTNLERELREFSGEQGKLGIMPTQKELIEAERNDLASAVRKAGGYPEVAKRLGFELPYTRKLRGYWQDFSNLEREIRAFNNERGVLGFMPTNEEFREAERGDIAYAILKQHGGFLAVAERLGLRLPSPRKPSGYWDDFSNLERELLAFIHDSGSPGFMPTQDELKRAGQSTLATAISRHGGFSAVAERLKLKSLYTAKPPGYWDDFSNLERELLTFIQEYGSAGVIPTDGELRTSGRSDLANAIRKHGGSQSVAERLGWTYAKKRHGYWDDFSNLEDEGERSTKEYRHTDYPFLLNADDPGMGKSASFLAAVCASGIKSIVLIAPKTVADDTWCGTNGEIHRCLPHAKIVRGLDKTLTASPASRLTFYVLHYEELLKSEAIATLAEQSFDCLCLDEIHFIKKRAGQQEGSLRREALKDLRQAAGAAIGLTGTPLINELAEPMSLLQTLSNDAPQFDHSRLSNRRLSDIADVFEALLPHIIRRRKRSVLLHLPSCDVQPVDIPLPEEIEQQMQETHKWPKSRATEQLNELRKLATEAKLAYLQQQAESARKLLILTYLTDDVSEKIAQYLEEFFPNQVAHINGQTPKEERQKQLDAFRNSDSMRVLVGTIRTIGTGLTLFDPSADDTANQIIIADLPYTWAEFEQGIARLHREGQKHRVCVSVLQTKMLATRGDGSAYHTIDEQIWALIQGKRKLSDVAVDGKYDINGASAKVQKALRRWLKQTREMGVEPRRVERRSDEQSEAQKWRRQIAHLRAISTAKADELFAEPEYTRQFLTHLKNSPILQLSHQWLRGKLSLLLRPDLTVIDMGCGLNPFADLPCRMIGLDRHHQPEQPSRQYVRGKMENPPLPDKSVDVLIYSLSLFGTPSDLMAYFTQAVRILRGGGHLFIVELDSTFTPEGLARFVKGLSKLGLELVGSVKDLWSQDGAKLKGMHFTLTGEMGQPEEAEFERK